MKEDLGLYGNQLNYMQTCWTVGYVIGEIPSNILLTKIRPRYWLPALEVDYTMSIVVPDILTIHLADMDYLDFLHLQSQQCYPTLYHSLLRRPCGISVLPWYAVYHWLLVPQRRTCQEVMYLPHQQCYRHYV